MKNSKMVRNKKAIELLTYPIWILRIMFLAILVVSIGFMISKYINIRTDVTAVESAIFLQRILHSDAVMFKDKATMQVYPAIVDISKLKDGEKKINEEINFGKDAAHLSAKISLESIKDVVYVNKRLFENLQIRASNKIFGTDVQQTQQEYLTFAYEAGRFNKEKLTIRVLQQK